MALTKIVKGMVATGAITPSNIESTSTFAFNKISTPEIVVDAGGLKLNTLRLSTSTSITFYNPATGELSYGPAGAAGGGTAYNQNLNTTDKVTFAGISATTATIGSLKINNSYTFPTNAGSAGQVLTTDGTSISWGAPNLRTNQDLYTSSTVSFAMVKTNYLSPLPGSPSTITVGGSLRLGFNTLPSTSGTVSLGTESSEFSNVYATRANFTYDVNVGSIVFGDGSIQTSAVPTDQSLRTTDVVRFAGLTATNITVKSIKAVAGTSINKIFIGGEASVPNSTGWGVDIAGPITVYGGYNQGDILPSGLFQSLGSSAKRWNSLYVKTIVVSKNTIIFEDDDTGSTSTLSVQTGTVYVDGTAVIDQNVTAGGSPIFSDTTITNSLTIGDYTMPIASASTAGYAMVTNGSGSIEFQQAVLSSNISIDGGFSTSVYTMDDFRVDGGGAFA